MRSTPGIQSAPSTGAPSTGGVVELPRQEQKPRTYVNRPAGYIVTYPPNWYASPFQYANAFVIRNHDAAHSISEKDQASVVISEEKTVSAEQAERRIQDLVSAASKGGSFQLEKVTMGQNVLSQWTVLESAAVPANAEKPVPSARMRKRVASAVILGAQIVRVEGTAWEDADPQVVTEMKEIARSIRLLSKKGETR